MPELTTQQAFHATESRTRLAKSADGRGWVSAAYVGGKWLEAEPTDHHTAQRAHRNDRILMALKLLGWSDQDCLIWYDNHGEDMGITIRLLRAAVKRGREEFQQ